MIFRLLAAAFLLAGLIAPLATAQPAPPPPGPPPGTSGDAPPGPPPGPPPGAAPADEMVAPEPERNTAGDTVTFTSGKKLVGVQILRETSSRLLIHIYSGLEPIEIPKVLVESIEYDDLDPSVTPLDSVKDKKPSGPELIAGKEVSPKLREQLLRAISDKALPMENTWDKIAEQLSQKVGVRLDITVAARTVMRRPGKTKVTVPPETSLNTFLQNTLRGKFKALVVRQKFDHIELAMPVDEDNGAPPGAPAPNTPPAAPPAGE